MRSSLFFHTFPIDKSSHEFPPQKNAEILRESAGDHGFSQSFLVRTPEPFRTSSSQAPLSEHAPRNETNKTMVDAWWKFILVSL